MNRSASLFTSILLLTLLTFTPALAKDAEIVFEGSGYANFSVEIRDISTGKTISNINAEKMLTPASILKLVTSASAITKYGPDHRFSTTASFSGALNQGIAVGDITIHASGDPTLYSAHFKENQTFIADIVESMKQLGITEVCGDIVIDNRCMPEAGPLPTWLIEDAFYTYGTGAYPLNYRDNTFILDTDGLTTNPSFSDADITYDFIAGEDLKRFHGAYTNQYTLIGDAPLNTRLSLPASDPLAIFAEALENALASAGIRFSNQYCEPAVNPERYILAEYKSPQLSLILKSLMTRSDNMMAEAVLRMLSPGATLDNALTEQTSILRDSLGVRDKFVRILDGSGLSRKNFVSAKFISDILRAMAKSPNAKDYTDIFPKAGVDGTVKNFMAKTPLKGRLRLKSGSMNGVRCYAGYLTDTKGNPRKTIVVMINDFVIPTSQINKSIETFLLSELNK